MDYDRIFLKYKFCMLLLYPKIYTSDHVGEKIYIPLCFYFILLTVLAEGLTGILFTFHYASTLSKTVRERQDESTDLHSTMLLLYHRQLWQTQSPQVFTFHYASTLSGSSPAFLRSISNLHSTMLLLYLYSPDQLIDQYFNLHSTMLLLYA